MQKKYMKSVVSLLLLKFFPALLPRMSIAQLLCLAALCSLTGCGEDSEARAKEIAEEAKRSANENAAQAMRVVSTTVPVTQGFKAQSSDIAIARDGRLYLARAEWGPAVEISSGKPIYSDIKMRGFARDFLGHVFGYSMDSKDKDDGVYLLEENGRTILIGKPKNPEMIATGSNGDLYMQMASLPNAHIQKIDAKGVITDVIPFARVAEDINNWGWHTFVVDSHGTFFLGGRSVIIKINKESLTENHGADKYEPALKGGEQVCKNIDLPALRIMRIDSHDNLYILYGDAVQKITPDCEVTTVLSSHCDAADAEAAAAAAKGCTKGLVDGPIQGQIITVNEFDADDDGNIYWADGNANAIRKIDAKGNVSTLIRGEFPQNYGGHF